MNHKLETWQDIPKFSKYKCSSFGRVKSFYSNKILKSSTSSRRYEKVALYRNKKAVMKDIHILVLETFVGKKPKKSFQACHLDGNSKNNNLSNLEWNTASKNNKDRYKHGYIAPFGDKHHNARLNKNLVVEIRTMAEKMDCKEISVKLGIPKLTIYDAVVGNSWKSINKIKAPVSLAGRQNGRIPK